MGFKKFEDLYVFQLAEQLANDVWDVVVTWDYFAKDTVGKQLVRAADSIGANISEGSGRGSHKDNQRFVKIARGSLNETRFWLRRAYKRKLLAPEQITLLKDTCEKLGPCLNLYLNSIGKYQDQPEDFPEVVKDEISEYLSETLKH